MSGMTSVFFVSAVHIKFVLYFLVGVIVFFNWWEMSVYKTLLKFQCVKLLSNVTYH